MKLGPQNSFAAFFFLQNLPRGMLLTVIPLQAYALMGNAQDTSALLFAVSIGGILAALVLPQIIKSIGLYPAYLLSCVTMVVSAIMMSIEQVWIFSAGLFFHVFSIAAAEVALSLYVMSRIARSDMTSFEPLRIFALVLALTIGPFLGVYFEARILHELPFIVCIVFMVASVFVFRLLKLQQTIVPASKSDSVNPLKYLSHYLKQPRLRLAYGLVLARSSWWTMFIIYAPIYAAQSDLGELTGAAIVSIGTAWTLSVPFWGWVARRYGVRQLLFWGFSFCSLLTFVVYLVVDKPYIASVVLIFCALGATMLDGVGNVLFFRAVRTGDRSEMTAVFVTYRDAGQLLTPGLYAVLLSFFALPVVFSTAAGWMIVAAWFCRYIPRRLR
ncbi:MAG: MFS transporter [Gammaproteobacteria bacterium]|nr:MFS transporter [Gammaproteobacteria bacterium]